MTAGIYSCSPASVARIAAELRAVSVYISRHVTGEIVDRKPFEGYRLSGLAIWPAVRTACTSSSIPG